MQQTELLARTVVLLRERPRAVTLQKIVDDTGLTMPWLSSLMKDPIPNRPSVHLVEILYNYLSDAPLFPK